jgi:hypothetical protein
MAQYVCAVSDPRPGSSGGLTAGNTSGLPTNIQRKTDLVITRKVG